MNVSLSSWFIILLALVAANLPFLNERVFCIIPLKATADGPANKGLWLRLLELIVLYALVGGLAFFLESRVGNRFVQGWEFFAVTGCLFLVLAYPGFVFRYLRKRHG